MQEIELNSTPNQSLGVTLNGINYKLNIKLFDDVLYMTVYAANVLLCSGVRAMPNQVVIPYPYLTDGGNFFWYCSDGEYPDWNKFNNRHKLLWLTDAEIAANVI